MRRPIAALGLLLGLALSVAARAADDDIRAKIKSAGDAEKWNADLVTVFDYTDVRVMPNGLGVANKHQLTKILRDGGARSQAVQRFTFDPHTNRLELQVIRVHRADGQVEDVPVTSPVRQPQPAAGIFWPTEQFVVELPRLAVGDAVETQTEMTGFNVAYLAADANAAAVAGMPPGFNDHNALGVPLEPPVTGHWHDEVHFWSAVPTIEKRYTVRVPKDKPLQYEVYNGELRTGVVLDGNDIFYSFEKKDIPAFKGEPNMESQPNVGCKLLLATLPSWEDKSRWLHGVSEPQFAWDDAIAAKTREIIKDCKTDEEKYTALNHWVAENIRYAGTSRGMCEGYTIHPSIETFHDRCGVCKDKAGMLVTMLRVAGFESYLTMTMARQRVDRVPADQFNHAVTVVREKDGNLRLLDPTWMPKSRDNWSTLEPDQHVVYGIPEGHGLATSPYFPPETCLAQWRGQTNLAADGGLSGSLEFTATGAPEGRLRRALAGLHPDDRHQLFDKTFQRVSSNTQLKRVECMDPVDFSGPIRVQADFAAGDYAVGNGSRRYVRLPLMQTVFGDRTLVDLFGNTTLEKRQYGIKLWATRLCKFEETIKLPANWKATELPEPVELDGPVAGLKFKLESEPGQLRYTCELTIKRWQIPPADYANFKQVMEKFEELTGPVVACEVEGGHVQR